MPQNQEQDRQGMSRNVKRDRPSAWLAGAFLISFFAIGASHWTIPYAKVALPSTLLGPWLLLVAVATAASRVFGGAGFWTATWVLGAAAPAAVLARVIVETNQDPTSHNLWPLEVIIAATVGVICSALGALVASLYGILAGHRRRA